MAVKSFTQQCPSCEANVPIKDRSLVGKKIDCPKCKYRFVVEDPATDDEKKDDAKSAKKPAAAKASAAAPAAKKPAPAAKGAPAKTSPDKKPSGKAKSDDNEDGEKKPRSKKQSGSNTTMMLGIGLGAVALVLLGIAGIFLAPMMFGDSNSVSYNSNSGITPMPSPGGTEDGGTGEEPPPMQEGGEKEAPILPDVTNFLPNDSQAVYSINVKRLLESSAGTAMFQTAGAFNRDHFRHTTGIPIDNVARVVSASNAAQKWVFNVIRTSKPFIKAELVRNLNTRPGPGGPIEGREWYLTEANYDPTSRFFLGGELASELALHVLDDYTFVLATPPVLQAFLKDKTKPKHLTDAAPVTPTPGGGMNPPGVDPAGGAGTPVGAEGGMPGVSDPSGMGQPPVVSTSVVGSDSYMTIPTPLKRVLDKLESGKQPVVFSTAADMKAAPDPKGLERQFGLLGSIGDAKMIEQQSQQFRTVGVALVNFAPNRLTGLGVVECQGADEAKALQLLASVALPSVADGLGKELDVKIKIPNAQMPPTGMGPGGIDEGGMGPGYGMPPGVDPMGMEGGAFPGSGGGVRPMPPNSGVQKTDSTISLQAQDKLLVFNFDVALKRESYDKVMGGARQMLIQAKGAYEMARGQNRIHELAAALSAAAKAKNHFPRGTAAREPSPDHGNLPWRPDQRVSWMPEVLPYLSGEFQGLSSQINGLGKSWREEENLVAAATLVPAFLSANSPPQSWWVNYPRVPVPVAATHFVGISGVGLDAAEYTSGDAAVAKRMGVFGYDRVTQLSDVTDGLRNTIAVIQVPPTIKAPWLASGGATVRGVPETDSIRPFVCAKHKDKPGTFAIFCDGTVRFIPATISDDDFKALCTIAGGEEVDLRKLTEEIPGGNVELKTQPLPLPMPKKEEPKPEEPKKEDPKPADPDAKPEVPEPKKEETPTP